MLQRWSIRAMLTTAVLLLAAVAATAGALGLVALGRATDSISTIAHADLVAMRSLSDTSSLLLRSRVALERVSSLLANGRTDDAQKALNRGAELLGQSRKAWQTFQATDKPGTDPALLQRLAGQYTNLMEKGVDPEFAALRANDLAAYHAIADTRISPMFVAFDSVAAPVTQSMQDHVNARETASESEIARMRMLIGAALVLAVLLVLVVYRAISVMIMRPLQSAVVCFDRIAAGDLSEAVPESGDNEIGRLFAGLRRMQERLVTMVKAVHDSTDSIDVGAGEIASGNTDLSSRTEQQAASLQETAASMEQLTGTVRQNADNARQASQLAANASTIATRGGEVVGQVVETMREISSSSAEVVDIIGVIEGIAFQTNILALNAAVEAARAGEQGRGFAVVAGEVRALAQRSASAAKDIKALIDESAAKVRGGAEQVDRAGATMQEILQAVSRVTDIMGEISAASDEQSRGIDQVSTAVTQMDEVTQQNAALVEQAAAAAGALKDQTGNLRKLMGAWKIGPQTAASAAATAEAARTAIKTRVADALKAAPVEPAMKQPAEPAVAKAQPKAEPKAEPKKIEQKAEPKVDQPPAPKKRPAAPVPRADAPRKATADADTDWETF